MHTKMPFEKSAIAMIPARYASSRLPGKCLLKIGGKSILQLTYEAAKRAQNIDQVVIATEDERILKAATEFGAPVIMTSDQCQNGTERIAEALDSLKDSPDIIVNVQGDEPFIEAQHIEEVVRLLQNNIDPACMVSTLFTQIFDQEAALSPHTVKVILDHHSHILYFSRALIPHGKDGLFDKDTPYFAHIGVFAFYRNYLKEFASSPKTSAQAREDIELLKVIESGYRIIAAEVKGAERGVNTNEDLNYLRKKYET